MLRNVVASESLYKNVFRLYIRFYQNTCSYSLGNIQISAKCEFKSVRPHVGIRDLTILGDGHGQNKLLQINGSKDSSWYIINRMNLIQF
jgi:hypothetical protein